MNIPKHEIKVNRGNTKSTFTYEQWKATAEETIKRAEYIKALMRKPYNTRTPVEQQELKKWYEGVKSI